MYTYATSFNSAKRNKIEAQLLQHNIDILAVTETWFTPDAIPNIPNYNLMRHDRISRKGGGVAIYSKKTVKVAEVYLHTSTNKAATGSEAVWVGIYARNERILVGCVYRPLILTAKAIVRY